MPRFVTVRNLVPLVSFLAVITVGFLPGASYAQDVGQQKPFALEKTVTKVLKSNYLLYLPKGYGSSPGQKWPVMIFLHGSGESGADLEKLKTHGPPKLVAQGQGFPFIIVSPQCPTARDGWNLEVLNALLDDVLAHYGVDEDRVYLTGLSMGGYGAWAWACANPERFAAVVPICGGGQRRQTRRMKDLPVWAFHGAKDPTVPLAESQEMVDALKGFGGTDVQLTIYPEAKHDSWTATYENPELYAWLLQHKRTRPVGTI